MTRQLDTRGDLDRLFGLVRRRLGLKPPTSVSQIADHQRRLLNLARERGYPEPRDLLDHLETTTDLETLHLLVRGLVAGETHFYRHPVQMSRLESLVFPEIVARKRDTTRRIVVWSAGCSTGEEPYTLSVLLTRLLADEAGWDLQVVGTDIDTHALEVAAAATYTSWSFRSVPEWFIHRGFREAGGRYELRKRYRRPVRFERFNLAGRPGLPEALGSESPDLILCRNVLIYMHEDTVRDIIGSLEGLLDPEGWLLVGPSESPMVSRHSNLASADRAGIGLFRRSEGPGVEDVDPVRDRSACPDFFPGSIPEDRPGAGFPVSVGEPGVLAGPADRLMGGDPGFRSAVPPSEESQLARAWELADRGLSGQALDAVTDVLHKEELLTEAYVLRGLLEKDLGRIDLAIESFRKALFLDWTMATAHYHLATTLMRQEDHRSARKHVNALRTLLRETPPHEEIPHTGGMTAGRVFATLEGLSARRVRA